MSNRTTAEQPSRMCLDPLDGLYRPSDYEDAKRELQLIVDDVKGQITRLVRRVNSHTPMDRALVNDRWMQVCLEDGYEDVAAQIERLGRGE